jgi:hypothetical protein
LRPRVIAYALCGTTSMLQKLTSFVASLENGACQDDRDDRVEYVWHVLVMEMDRLSLLVERDAEKLYTMLRATPKAVAS